MNTISFFTCCYMICLPLRHLCVTSAYGHRIHPITGRYQFHEGIDLKANCDTVFAVTCGRVSVNDDQRLGIYICIDDGLLSCTYGHLSQVLVTEDDYVLPGTPIAFSGSTGRVTGPHLHLSIKYDGQPIDPVKLLYQTLKSSSNE